MNIAGLKKTFKKMLSINYVGCKYKRYKSNKSNTFWLSINYVGCKFSSLLFKVSLFTGWALTMWDVNSRKSGDEYKDVWLSINYVGCKSLFDLENAIQNGGWALTMWDVNVAGLTSINGLELVEH